MQLTECDAIVKTIVNELMNVMQLFYRNSKSLTWKVNQNDKFRYKNIQKNSIFFQQILDFASTNIPSFVAKTVVLHTSTERDGLFVSFWILCQNF